MTVQNCIKLRKCPAMQTHLHLWSLPLKQSRNQVLNVNLLAGSISDNQSSDLASSIHRLTLVTSAGLLMRARLLVLAVSVSPSSASRMLSSSKRIPNNENDTI